MDERKIRIPSHVAMMMLGTAFFYDVIQAVFNLIPFLGQAVSYLMIGITFMTFNVLWFHIRGVYFFESLIGKGIRGRVMKVMCPVIEIATLGIAPGITIWIAITIFQSRLDDELVARGVVTREELERLDSQVKSLYKKHGIDSPEFRNALAQNLG